MTIGSTLDRLRSGCRYVGPAPTRLIRVTVWQDGLGPVGARPRIFCLLRIARVLGDDAASTEGSHKRLPAHSQNAWASHQSTQVTGSVALEPGLNSATPHCVVRISGDPRRVPSGLIARVPTAFIRGLTRHVGAFRCQERRVLGLRNLRDVDAERSDALHLWSTGGGTRPGTATCTPIRTTRSVRAARAADTCCAPVAADRAGAAHPASATTPAIASRPPTVGAAELSTRALTRTDARTRIPGGAVAGSSSAATAIVRSARKGQYGDSYYQP